MSETTIQAQMQDLLQATSTFDDADVTLGDFSVFSRGAGPFAIITPGPADGDRPGDWSQSRTIWTVYVEVWARFPGDDFSALVTARGAVWDLFFQNPTLDGLAGVILCTPVRMEDPIGLWMQGQPTTTKPQYIGSRMRVEVVEETLQAGSGEFA